MVVLESEEAMREANGGYAVSLLRSVLVGSFLLLCLLVLTSPGQLRYDEIYHVEGARLLERGASLLELITTPLPSAPGPLYPVLHAAFAPGGLNAGSMRALNLITLVFAVAAAAYTIRKLGYGNAVARSGMVLALPLTWVIGGLALTEMPAIALVSMAAAVAVGSASSAGVTKKISYLGFATGGMFLGLAILGRQTYLPVAGLFMLVAYVEPRLRGPSLLGGLIAISVPAPVFYVWGALVPPSTSFAASGIVIKHGVLSFGYLGAFIAFLAPTFFLTRWRSILAASAGAGTLALISSFEHPFALGLFKRLPDALSDYNGAIGGAFLAITSGAVAAALILNAWDRRESDRTFVLWVIATALVTATSFGITHLFSARYTIAALPFLLFMVQPYLEINRWAATRVLAGSALGALSLSNYYAISF